MKMSMLRRVAKVELEFERLGGGGPRDPRSMTDRELWAAILEIAGLPATPDNIAEHMKFNEHRLDTVWVKVKDEWVDGYADARRRHGANALGIVRDVK
jgi:hypothetical protein